jgi:multidrug resistance efflux pump
MPNNNIEIHSDEVQDIMGNIPHWIIRRGTMVVFAILISIFIGAYVIRYPEIISGSIVLTTSSPPVDLIAKSAGAIEKIFVEEGTKVESGTFIAVIQSTANWEDVLRLKNILKKISQSDSSIKEYKRLSFHLQLGENQNAFSDFQKSWNNLQFFLEQQLIPNQIYLIQQQIIKQKQDLDNLKTQLILQKEDLNYEQKSFCRDSILHFTDHVLSKLDYENSYRKLLMGQMTYQSLKSSMIQSENSILQLQQNVEELKMEYQKQIEENQTLVNQKLQILGAQLKLWEELYLLQSPIKGLVTFTQYWSANQYISAGDRLATVVPAIENKIIGKIRIPSSGFGKVKEGQTVQIKLDGFPYMEYGMLEGKIVSIAKVAELDNGSTQKRYWFAEVHLKSGMHTTYQEQLKFTQQLGGNADIITAERRVISRFIEPLRFIWETNIKNQPS